MLDSACDARDGAQWARSSRCQWSPMGVVHEQPSLHFNSLSTNGATGAERARLGARRAAAGPVGRRRSMSVVAHRFGS